MWLNTNTNDVYNYIHEIRYAFADISLPENPTDSDFESIAVYPVAQTPIPIYDPITQGCKELSPEQDTSGNWVRVYEVFALTPEDIVQREEAAKQANKRQAEALLQASDWSQYPDVTNPTNVPHLTNGDAWMFYRLELRSIAINPPVVIDTWPVKPEELWSTTV